MCRHRRRGAGALRFAPATLWMVDTGMAGSPREMRRRHSLRSSQLDCEMNTRHQIAIPCHPANPVDYLACCGLADILARIDRIAQTHWRIAAPLGFVMESTLT